MILLGAFLAMVALMLGQMSTATVIRSAPPPVQTIADPFCATSQEDLTLEATTVVKQEADITVSWRFADPMPSALLVKIDLASNDFKYHWVVSAVVEKGAVSRIETLDTVSNQPISYQVGSGLTTARVMGHWVEVTVPLPGAPEVFSWFAAAGPMADDPTDLAAAQYVAFCPAGWLAKYPPSA